MLGECVWILDSQVVYARGLLWPLLGFERGGRGGLPFGVGQFADIFVFRVGAGPIALEVPTHDLDLVW